MGNGHEPWERIPGTTPAVKLAARELRCRAVETPAERVLWQALRNRGLGGLKFRRQQPLGPFVVDFFCASCRLVVEVDGTIHEDEDRAAQDAARTEILAAHGFRVIRFRNEEVLNDLDGVLMRIFETANAVQAALPSPADRERGWG